MSLGWEASTETIISREPSEFLYCLFSVMQSIVSPSLPEWALLSRTWWLNIIHNKRKKCAEHGKRRFQFKDYNKQISAIYYMQLIYQLFYNSNTLNGSQNQFVHGTECRCAFILCETIIMVICIFNKFNLFGNAL